MQLTLITLYLRLPTLRLALQGGFTPLYIAAEAGHVEAVEQLIAARAKVESVSKVLLARARSSQSSNSIPLVDSGCKVKDIVLPDQATGLLLWAQHPLPYCMKYGIAPIDLSSALLLFCTRRMGALPCSWRPKTAT